MSNKSLDKSDVKKSELSGKTKIYLLVLVVGIGLIATGLYYKNDKGSDQAAKEDNSAELVAEEKKDEASKNYLEGILNNSEDLKLGNYKLASKDGDIYLRTARDFSKLLGSQVMVFINGTKDKFELKDIQSKVAGDSYILP